MHTVRRSRAERDHVAVSSLAVARRAAIAEPKMSAQLLSAMPVAMFVIIYVMNPSYMRPMLDSGAGKAMLGLCAGLIVIGYTVMSRIADVEM